MQNFRKTIERSPRYSKTDHRQTDHEQLHLVRVQYKQDWIVNYLFIDLYDSSMDV